MSDRNLLVKAINAGKNLRLTTGKPQEFATVHPDRAAKGTPDRAIRVNVMSIPEQTELATTNIRFPTDTSTPVILRVKVHHRSRPTATI